MNERNAVDMLLDYPKKHNLDYDTHDSHLRFYLFPKDPILNTKYVVFKKNDLFFCAYDSFGAKMFMTDTFTGIYGVIDIPKGDEITITKKDWTDMIFTFNKVKSGIKDVDSKLTITYNKKRLPQELFSNELVNSFLELEKHIHPIKLRIEFDMLHIVGELKDKMVVGLETNRWIYEEDEVDKFVELGEKVLNEIKKRASK